MADNEMENMEGMENEDLIIFEDDDGKEYTFQVEDYFFYNGEEYALLAEVNEACANCEGDCEACETVEETPVECIVCKIEVSTDDNGEDTEEFVPVEDTELAQKLFEIANKKLTEEEEEEDE